MVPAMLGLCGADWVERPLPWSAEREALTAAYIALHYGPRPSTDIVPRMVVVHWTATTTADEAFALMAPTTVSGRPELAGGVNVSAHFLVDRDGTVYRLMPESKMARHVIGLNLVAIGIENVGGPELPLTEAQLDADERLIRDLAARHPITHCIGHHEYRQMEAHPYWAERDPSYRTDKDDPGPEFMMRLRERLGSVCRGPG